MNSDLQGCILEITGAEAIANVCLVQTLWSDFGAIERVSLVGGQVDSVIVKRIQVPTEMRHPRGWNSTFSIRRKLHSYEIERNWYQNFVSNIPEEIKVPRFLFHGIVKGETYLIMEDLQSIGFLGDFEINIKCFNACLNWLANFHAFHMGIQPNGLWEVGTYWHLSTRPEEFEKMNSGTLKDLAFTIDARLNSCEFQTLVHGDAKPANFCFSANGEVAAVDFQYVGGGCGIKDVVYLMSSVLSESELFEQDEEILERYFNFLQDALEKYKRTDIDFVSLKKEWLSLYSAIWVDFLRFLKGWSPNHSRVNEYMLAQLRQFNS